MIDDTITAIKNVNDKIDTVSDLTSDSSKNIFSTTSVLKDQVKDAVTNEKSAAGTGTVNFKDTSAVDTAASNAVPTDIA